MMKRRMMLLSNTVDKVITIANAEVGYLEKESNKYLDHNSAII